MESVLIRRAAGVAALASSAALYYFGTGLTPIAALAWIAPLPVLLLAPRIPAWGATGIAFFAYFAGTANSWAFYYDSVDVPLVAGAVICIGMSLMFALSAWIFRALAVQGRAVLAASAGAASWVGLLYLVSLVSPLGIVGTLATTQADVPLVLQVSSVTGAWGVEFLVLFVPSAIAALLAPGVRVAAQVRTTVSVAVVAGLVFGAGAMRLSSGSEPGTRVALIAHNTSGWGVDVASPEGHGLLASYIEQIRALPPGVQAVVLPEGQFSVDGAGFAALAQPLTQAARERQVSIIAGVIRRDPDAKVNTAIVFPAVAGPPESYRKQHDQVSPPSNDLVQSRVAGVRVGLAICADVNFPDPARDYAAAGSRMLAVPASNEDVNGWQHSRTALLRSAETGQSVLWSARRGALLVSDGYGRVHAETRTGGAEPFTTLVTEAPPGPGGTPYAFLGDWFPLLCSLLTAGALAVIGLRRENRTADRTAEPQLQSVS